MQAVELESLNHARGVASTWHRVDYVRRDVTELPAMVLEDANVSEYKYIYFVQFNINMYIICNILNSTLK